MINDKKLASIFIVALSISIKSASQLSDSILLNKISNNNIGYDIALTKSYKSKSDKLGMSIETIHINSFSIDSLFKMVDKIELIKKLVSLLDNPQYDWGANLVLYSLTKKIAIRFIVVENRNEWQKKFKTEDIEYWRAFFKGIEFGAYVRQGASQEKIFK